MSIENSFGNKIEQISFEENPFEDETVSREWINSVENEKDMARDREIYPRLSKWIEEAAPKVVVEIGSGQGICSDKMEGYDGRYIGIEPSAVLVERAEELYKNENRNFIIGNAYELPLPNECCDAGFAVNVWFHLENLDQAAKELARILKPNGKFMIMTVNPDEYENWLRTYENIQEDGKKVVGKANTPIVSLSKNIFYRHSLWEMKKSFEQNGLKINAIEAFGTGGKSGVDYFMQIMGIKIIKQDENA
ncbi:MAG: class I SAM-dependent methyltransferase [Candidatus Moranbacteria bacterium]|nr:class I SAM-dependent methyltransferase [Candidatus Moranbacteria bacterium]